MAREQKNFAQEKVGRDAPASTCARSSVRSPLAANDAHPHPKDSFHLLLKALARDLAHSDYARED